jgi:sensor histidine kinase YesM
MQTIQFIHFSVEMWGALFSFVGALIVFLTRYFDRVGSRKLILVLLCAALLMISDGLAWLYRGNPTEAGYYIVRISNFASFFFGFLIMPLAAQYVAHLIYTRSNGVRLYWENFEWGIFIFGAALLILNEFVPYIYLIDETNTYQRLPYFFWVPGFIAFVGAVITLSVAVAYSKYMSALENAAIIMFLSLPIIAIIMQMIFYGVSFVNLAIVISTVILFVSYESYFAQYLVDKEKQVNEAKLRLINRQMHPHFVFNSLALIRHQCLSDPEKAAETINEFSAYLRRTVDLMTESECISFEKEMEIVRYYINIQQKRFDKILNVQYQIRDTEFDVPPFSIQTLVENALHHGINDGQLAGGSVIISTEKIKNKHIVTVEDNGNGFDTAVLDQEDHHHIGINNTRERVAAMCDGTMSIESAPGKGTKVTMVIPN